MMKIRIILYFIISLFFSCKRDKFLKTYYVDGKIKTEYLLKDSKLVYYKSYYNDGKVYTFFNRKINDTLFIYNKKGINIGKKILNKKGKMISIFHPQNSNKKDYIEILKDTLNYGKNWVKLRYHTKFPHVDDKKNMKILNIIIKNNYKNGENKLDTFGFNKKYYKNGIFEVGFGVNIYERDIDTTRVNIKIIKDFYYVNKPNTLNLINKHTVILLNKVFFIRDNGIN